MAWNRSLLVSKCKALAAHLSLSALLLGAALAVMFEYWLPAPLFHTSGGGEGLKLLVLVDMVLGPALTFVVFNAAKRRRELLLDLSLIAAIQLAGFGYGLWNIHEVRVQALAYYQGEFHPVPANLFKDQQIEADGWSRLGAGLPYLVDVREAQGEEADGVTAFAFMQGLEPQQLHFLYQPFSKAPPEHRQQGRSLSELERQYPAVAVAAKRWLAGQALEATDLRYYRVVDIFGAAVLAIDSSGQWRGGFVAELPAAPSKAEAPAKPSSG